MSATFSPLKFDGSTDGALQCLYLALIGKYGEQPPEVLERINSVVPTRGIRLVAQFDDPLYPPIEEYAIALDPREPGIAPYMNAGALTLEWVDSEGYTRIGIKPDPAFHEALALLHGWLGVTLGEQGLLVGAEVCEEEDEPSEPEPVEPWGKFAPERVNPGAHRKIVEAWWLHKGNAQAVADLLGTQKQNIQNELTKIRNYAGRDVAPYQGDFP